MDIKKMRYNSNSTETTNTAGWRSHPCNYRVLSPKFLARVCLLQTRTHITHLRCRFGYIIQLVQTAHFSCAIAALFELPWPVGNPDEYLASKVILKLALRTVTSYLFGRIRIVLRLRQVISILHHNHFDEEIHYSRGQKVW